jgi:hypothetical protein
MRPDGPARGTPDEALTHHSSRKKAKGFSISAAGADVNRNRSLRAPRPAADVFIVD